MSYFRNFIELFYPRICYACGGSLHAHEEIVCAICLHQLPKTNFYIQAENPLTEALWGRVPLEHVSAMLYFHKGNKVQNLIHHLKYKGQKEIGHYLGMIDGKDLLKSSFYQKVDVIVPVPLHPKKKRKRGYNQSEIIAQGIAEILKKPVDTKTLVKTIASESQTRKSRLNRWLNVKEVFSVSDKNCLKDKHILLVDDVFTTGATCDACATQLMEIPGVKISVVTIACTVQ